MSSTNRPPSVIVAGMHCSGTRLIAGMLAALSVRMGDHLRTAESRRGAGRFEDDKFVRFHRRVLARATVHGEPGFADWGWTESERVDTGCFADFREAARRLLATRASNHEPSGWEDPRATLFLDQWDELVEDARYLLVYGFPWDVAEALQWVWIEEFLLHPEYAYRIWNFYNQRLRDFYVKHADRCLLVNINAVYANLDRFLFLLGKLGIPTVDLGVAEVVESHRPTHIADLKSWIEPALVGNLRSRWTDDKFRTRWIRVQRQDPLVDLSVLAWPASAKLLSELDGLADISGDGLWQSKAVKSRFLRPDAGEGADVNLSVITPCYNQGTLLIDAIASLERNAPPGCELIIVNDGSTDARTLEIFDALRNAGYCVFDQENAGLSAARNRGISMARGRYILPLDDDNRIRDGFIEGAIRVLDSNPEVGVVYGDRHDFGWYHKVRKVPEFDLYSLLELNFIDACAVLRKKLWLDCGGYDTTVDVLADWELWVSAAEREWQFHHLGFVTFDYRVRPGSMISVFTSKDIWENLCNKIRDKHSQFYWTVFNGRIEALKSELDSLTSAVNGGPGKVSQLAAELKARNSQLEESDREINELHAEIETLGLRLAQQNAELSRMRNSFGWRLMQRYGRIKYRYLLPIYRLFGHAPLAK